MKVERSGPGVSAETDHPTPSGTRALVEADRRDLQERIRKRRSAARFHTIWAFLGVSPPAVLPLLVVLTETGFAMAIVFAFFIGGVESWNAVQAWMDVKALEEELEQLESPFPDCTGNQEDSRP